MIGKKEKIVLIILSLILSIILIRNGYGIKLTIIAFLVYILYKYKK